MPFTVAGKNIMLNALLRGTAAPTTVGYVGALQADAGKSVTAVAATDLFTSAGHGYANGDLVVLSALTGGAGVKAGEPLFVIGQTANTFQLSRTPGGSAIDLTSDLTGGTVTRLVELSGGTPAYARVAIAFNVAVDGSSDDSTNGATLNVPAGASVDYTAYYSAATAGTLHVIVPQTRETYAAQGTYTVTDADFDLNA